MRKIKLELNIEELEDIWASLAFFNRDYPDQEGSKVTRAAMRKLIVKIRKAIKEAK